MLENRISRAPYRFYIYLFFRKLEVPLFWYVCRSVFRIRDALYICENKIFLDNFFQHQLRALIAKNIVSRPKLKFSMDSMLEASMG